MKNNLDNDDPFHDSLDRLLSSSNTSCSSSDNEQEDATSLHNSGFTSPVPGPPIPRFPKALANNYDIWVSQPFSSVHERRLNLLNNMGLSQDPALLRHRPSLSFSDRSNNNNSFYQNDVDIVVQNNNSCSNSTVQGIVRSKSDDQNQHFVAPICNRDSTPVNNNNVEINHQNDDVESIYENGSPNKPPSGKFSCKGEVKEDLVCLIKDLDNGEEFLVNEVKEDGSWNRLKEVWTVDDGGV